MQNKYVREKVTQILWKKINIKNVTCNLYANCESIFFSKIDIYDMLKHVILFNYLTIYVLKYIIFMLFAYLLVNCVMLTPKNVEYSNNIITSH